MAIVLTCERPRWWRQCAYIAQGSTHSVEKQRALLKLTVLLGTAFDSQATATAAIAVAVSRQSKAIAVYVQ